MYNIRKVQTDTWWLGASDRRLALFENAYPTPGGMAYNNYLILDDKTCLMDGIDDAVSRQFMDNLVKALDGRSLDYMVVQHMEPDHCAIIPELLNRYPELRIVGSQKAVQMIKQFYHIDVDAVTVKEKDTLELGHHTLTFYTAPMVHWPEVIVTYDDVTGALFSADAFGAFGALSGNIFADEVDWEHDHKDETRRYYANIVGKYGIQVNALLKKLSDIDIKCILPLHGHLFRNDISEIIGLYKKWAGWVPEKQSVAIFYGSVYGNTANASDILAMDLAEHGIKDVKVYDVSKTDTSTLLEKAFEYSHLVFASSTYNAEIFDNMHTFLTDMKNHNLSGRTVGFMENGSWASQSGKKMTDLIGSMKNMTILEPMVTITSSVDESSREKIDELAKALAESLE
ncbi:FprA family A-type flavoprotein [Oribacterium sp. WCC10]|uniref:FprA family A-type flavoprotein n=1 Tax=Oribacterium sp. WCC10 TaxID=1855343 RepID=UPI0008E81BD3|nr:FprA family A-type flavoprotein [Oribacterium sp. WCC10]SFG42916.1 Flavorubredoxin [Oribacterium sp. WCC10]